MLRVQHITQHRQCVGAVDRSHTAVRQKLAQAARCLLRLLRCQIRGGDAHHGIGIVGLDLEDLFSKLARLGMIAAKRGDCGESGERSDVRFVFQGFVETAVRLFNSPQRQ